MATTETDRPRQAFLRLRSRSTGRWLVHPQLKEKLVADAAAADTNMTDVAVGILAGKYDVALERNGRRAVASASTSELVLNLPPALATKIELASIRRFGRARLTDEILLALHGHYGLALPTRR